MIKTQARKQFKALDFACGANVRFDCCGTYENCQSVRSGKFCGTNVSKGDKSAECFARSISFASKGKRSCCAGDGKYLNLCEGCDGNKSGGLSVKNCDCCRNGESNITCTNSQNYASRSSCKTGKRGDGNE